MRNVLLPHTLKELWNILAEEPDALVYAGGTDLLVKVRQRLVNPPCLVCLESLEELKGVREHGDEVFIGACSTLADLLSDSTIRRNFPLLTKGLRVLGSPPIRNMGTIGGNICTASPAGDTLPPLYAMDADLEIESGDSRQRIPLKGFILGPGQTRLKKGEMLAGLWLKKDSDFNLYHFEKVGQRNSLAISIASLAALLKVSKEGIIERARLAWGSVAPTIVTSTELEVRLRGKPLSRETLEGAVPLVRELISPIDDIRATAPYRKAVAGNLLLRLLAVPLSPPPSSPRRLCCNEL